MTTHPALIGLTNKATTCPLGLSYWSQTPYKAGDGAVKYFAFSSPGRERPIVSLNDSPDRMREAMIEQLTLQKAGAEFDFA